MKALFEAGDQSKSPLNIKTTYGLESDIGLQAETIDLSAFKAISKKYISI
jgi:hypothetical protein